MFWYSDNVSNFLHTFTRSLHTRNDHAVSDTGMTLDPNSTSANYTHGLAGVQQNGNWLVSNALVSIFLVLLLCVLLFRVWHLCASWLRMVVLVGETRHQAYWAQNQSQLWARIKRNFLYAPLGRNRHNKEFQLSKAVNMGTLPGRLHAAILVSYLLSNLIFCFTLDWQTQSSAVVAALRGRFGQLATLNLIPTILFALRNNPLIYLTGISYDTFNLFHRWCARIMSFEAGMHVLCWGINNLRSGGIDQVDAGLASSASFQWGMVAMCTMALIVFISPSPMRHAFYDIFLASHRVLVLLAIIGVYIHIERAHLPQLPYVQAVFMLWGYELAARYTKIFWWNVSPKRGITPVKIEALAVNTCRVTFYLRRSWEYRPGCYAQAYLPTISPWSSHPFSIAWAESSMAEDALDSASDIAQLGDEKSDPEKGKITVTKYVDRVTLLCRARAGFTKKMFNKANNADGKVIHTWGFLEGPYGGLDTYKSYGTVVLFAAGIGITHCIGYVRHLLELHNNGLCATERIVLVWTVPSPECLEWTGPWISRIMSMTNRSKVLRIRLFISSRKLHGDAVSSTGTVTMQSGRPDLQLIMNDEMNQRIGAMAVTVCGPGAFSDAVRTEVRKHVEEGNVDFVEESFTY